MVARPSPWLHPKMNPSKSLFVILGQATPHTKPGVSKIIPKGWNRFPQKNKKIHEQGVFERFFLASARFLGFFPSRKNWEGVRELKPKHYRCKNGMVITLYSRGREDKEFSHSPFFHHFAADLLQEIEKLP